MMQHILYNSTRGNDFGNTSSKAILKGICDDGGLFIPDTIPTLDNIETLKDMEYKQIACYIFKKFLTDFTEKEIFDCVEKAYNDKFDCKEITPLKKINNMFFLELFHGPTLAFKDLALSVLPHLLTTSAKKQNLEKEIVILTATSGDTGKAALEGFKDVDKTKIIVFYPKDGVSEIQKLQMVTQEGQNTFISGIKGNFDDAQTAVKNIFTDTSFKQYLSKNNYIFSSANSINIGRLIPQIIYYVYSYCTLLKQQEINMGENINVVVPTGNFGNILAAYYAKNMGLPINKLICASNDNKVLYDFFSTGNYDRNRNFITTISPSMDILISSNLERLLYYICKGDTKIVKNLMDSLKIKGNYEISDSMNKELNQFYAGYADEDSVKNNIKYVFENYGYLIDPHTAVAYCVYDDYVKATKDTTKTIIASTASPYKFAPAVMSSIDKKYFEYDLFELINTMSDISNIPVPKKILELKDAYIKHSEIIDKEDMKSYIESLLNLKN